MASIQFNCPQCNNLIAFESKHIGKRAHCLSCGQVLIIPLKDYGPAQKIESPQEFECPEPLSGFYRAVFADNFRMFFKNTGVTGLIFIAAAVCFKFFFGHIDYSFTAGGIRVQAPFGQVLLLVTWGYILWYYMEIISSAAFGVDELPDVYMGGFFSMIWNIIKSLYLFFVAMVIAELPYFASAVISRIFNIQMPGFLYLLAVGGVFIFPIVILVIAIRGDMSMLLPRCILRPVLRAFCPYIVVSGLFLLAWQLQIRTLWYIDACDRGFWVVALHLFANLGVQIIAITAMRSIGLFYYHYNCYFLW